MGSVERFAEGIGAIITRRDERIAALTAELREAKAGWDSAIADLREASNICKGVEERLREAKQECERLGQQLAEADFDFGGWRSIKARLEAENATLRATVERMGRPVSDEDDQELRILKAKDALLWLEESSLNMRKRLQDKGDIEIARQSDITALYIKATLEAALLASRKATP